MRRAATLSLTFSDRPQSGGAGVLPHFRHPCIGTYSSQAQVSVQIRLSTIKDSDDDMNIFHFATSLEIIHMIQHFYLQLCMINLINRAAGTYLNMVRTYIFEIDPLAHLTPTSLCAMTYGIQCKTKKS